MEIMVPMNVMQYQGATEDVEEPNYQERSNEEKDETVKEKEKKDEEENRGEVR